MSGAAVTLCGHKEAWEESKPLPFMVYSQKKEKNIRDAHWKKSNAGTAFGDGSQCSSSSWDKKWWPKWCLLNPLLEGHVYRDILICRGKNLKLAENLQTLLYSHDNTERLSQRALLVAAELLQYNIINAALNVTIKRTSNEQFVFLR